MMIPSRPPRNRYVAMVRRIYNPIGFSKGYNFILWFIFGGALLGFALSRLMYLNIDGILCTKTPSHGGGAVPGECYYYQGGIGRAGIIMHLGGILPASILVVLQFVPVIRHKMLLFHRINGYGVIFLALVGTVGAFMIARNSFGGGLDVQTHIGMSGLIFVSCLALSYYNIKRLQIEQHRAWMLRGWVTAGNIITLRLLSKIMTQITSSPGPYYTVRPCAVVDHMFQNAQAIVEKLYPECVAYYSGQNLNQHVTIPADMTSGRPDQISSGLNVTFGAAGWLALTIHLIAVEVYLHLTPAEAERLRRVSYQRQLEAGMKDPGNTGLTVQRVGDAEPWVCPGEMRLTDHQGSSSTVASSERTVRKYNGY